jgi:hypothetical protein
MKGASKCPSVPVAVAVAVTMVAAAACATEQSEQLQVVALEELGIEYVAGADETGPADAVLDHLVDAAILGDTLAVLDASAPFVKLFDPSGRFVGTRVNRGEGPGEASRPIAIGRAGPRYLLVTEPKWMMLIDLDSIGDAGMQSRVGRDDRVFRGSAVGCGGELFTLLTTNGFEQPGAVTVGRNLAGPADTLSRLAPIRANSQMAHPLFMDAGEDAVVFYTEEVDGNRLLTIDCGTRTTTDIAVDSLGTQQWYEETQTGFSLHPWEPPHPAGVAVTSDGILWAAQVVDVDGETQDSLTMVSLVRNGAGTRRAIALRGWYQLLDSHPDGRLVLGTHRPVSSVAVIRTETLLDVIRERGIDRPVGEQGAARP